MDFLGKIMTDLETYDRTKLLLSVQVGWLFQYISTRECLKQKPAFTSPEPADLWWPLQMHLRTITRKDKDRTGVLLTRVKQLIFSRLRSEISTIFPTRLILNSSRQITIVITLFRITNNVTKKNDYELTWLNSIYTVTVAYFQIAP